MLRRADPDDYDEIINLVEIGEDDIYNRVYSFPNVLKLIETAYLAITVIDREGRVVAFAAFEDFPTVSESFYCSWHGLQRPPPRGRVSLRTTRQGWGAPERPRIWHAVTCMRLRAFSVAGKKIQIWLG